MSRDGATKRAGPSRNRPRALQVFPAVPLYERSGIFGGLTPSPTHPEARQLGGKGLAVGGGAHRRDDPPGTSGFPQATTGHVDREIVVARRARDRGAGVPLLVDPAVEILQEGDIISIDCGASMGGYFGDSAVTLPVGQVSEDAASLLRVTEESLFKGIAHARAGAER